VSVTTPGFVIPTTPEPSVEEVGLDAVVRLARSIRQEAGELTRGHVMGIVRAYYQFQQPRIAFNAQAKEARALGHSDLIPMHFMVQSRRLETQARAILGEWAAEFTAGQWLQRQYGIGPVISAGLLAHLDITRAPAASHFWSFAGSNPEMVWNKGERRPFNAELKSLCWRMVDVFVKHRNDIDDQGAYKCWYGRHYQAKKDQLVARNNAGGFAELAAATLRDRNIRKAEVLEVYRSGRIPDGRVDAQARRWTWKLVLAHLHTRMCEEAGIQPPKPYSISYLDHVHQIDIPD
jgi:hypothetical protein